MGVGVERGSGYAAYHGSSTPALAAGAVRDGVGRAHMARSGPRRRYDGVDALGNEQADILDRKTGGRGSFMAVELKRENAFGQANMREARDSLRGRHVLVC